MNLGRVLALLALLAPAQLLADEPKPEPEKPKPPPVPPAPPRPVPDYDGVPDPPPTAGEVLIWVPRVVFFPAWLVSEFIIRRPLGWLTVTAERNHWPSEIISFFTFGNSSMGFVPTFYIDLGFRPTFGVYYFYDDVFGNTDHSFRFRANGTIDGYSFALTDRWQTDPYGSRVHFSGDISLRPDRAFYGIGPDTFDSDLHRYGFFTVGGSVGFDWHIVPGVRVDTTVAIHSNEFTDPRCCDDPPVSSLPVLPTGFPRGYTTFTQSIEAVFDSRPPRPAAQTGLRLRLAGDHSRDLREGNDWIRMTGTIGAFWDVARLGRILGLTFTMADIEEIKGEMPFPELISFGGNGLAMPGLRPDRLFGFSAASASFRYEWPIWVALGGSLQVEVGNVFDKHFKDFNLDLMRMSFALGFRTIGAPDHAFQVLVGVGTETFRSGTELTSFRLSIGGPYGF
jgi:hypothetical protein